jgi:hypothetical protein
MLEYPFGFEFHGLLPIGLTVDWCVFEHKCNQNSIDWMIKVELSTTLGSWDFRAHPVSGIGSFIGQMSGIIFIMKDILLDKQPPCQRFVIANVFEVKKSMS